MFIFCIHSLPVIPPELRCLDGMFLSLDQSSHNNNKNNKVFGSLGFFLYLLDPLPTCLDSSHHQVDITFLVGDDSKNPSVLKTHQFIFFFVR